MQHQWLPSRDAAEHAAGLIGAERNDPVGHRHFVGIRLAVMVALPWLPIVVGG